MAGVQDNSDLVTESIQPIIEFGQQQGEICEGDPHTLAYVFQCAIWGIAGASRDFPDRYDKKAPEQLIAFFRKNRTDSL